ncbi:MAG: ATP-binding cassette domain-containing protein [Thermomicrobiales bacterium]
METNTATRSARTPSASREIVIDVRGLVKRYGDLTAVNGIDLSVYKGEIFGILGPNGAGKTTTLEMLEGLRAPDAGSITVAGIDAVADPEKLRTVIGAQLQTTALFPYLSAAELIELFCGLYDVDASKARVDELLTMVDLQEKRESKVNELSGGQRQRLAITLALVNHPEVTFLDEPTTGLDPGARRALWKTIEDVAASGTTVVLTTHYMEEAEVLCDRIALFDRGEVIACDTTQGLIRSLNMAATVRATVRGGELTAPELAKLPEVTNAEVTPVDGGAFDISLTTKNVQQTLIGFLALADRRAIELGDLRSTQASLEDVFLSLTGRTYANNDAAPAPDEKKKRRRGGRS